MSSFFSSDAARATLFHAVLVGAVTILKSAANAAFLANCPPSWLAMLYVCVAGVVVVATILLAGPLSRIPPARLLVLATWGLSLASAAVAALAFTGAPICLAALYLCAEVYATLLSVLFWTTISGWFDARTARTTFGIVSAGGMAGGMVCGLCMRALVGGLGAAGTALVASLLTVLALPLLRHQQLALAASKPRAPAASMQSGASYLLRRPYPRYIASLACVFAMLSACVDFVFRVDAAQALDEAELAALFGDLNAVVGAAAIVYQLALTRRVLQRGGLFVFLSVVPVLLVAVSAAAALAGSLMLIIVMKGLEMAGSYSIQQAGMQLLYNPIPAEARAAVRAFVDGVVRKGGLAASGVLLVVVAGAFPAAISPWLVATFALACLVLLRFVRGGYLAALEDKLRGSRGAVVVETVVVGDRATRKLLVEVLASDSPEDVKTAIALLKGDPRFDAEPYLPRLLTHEDDEVRTAALDLVPGSPSPTLEAALERIVTTDHGQPRAAAVRAYARVLPETARALLPAFLRDPEPGVVSACIAALYGHASTRPAALARLNELLTSIVDAPPPLRAEIARLLGELPLALAEEYLPFLLGDPDALVRAACLGSAARLFADAATRGVHLRDVFALVSAVRERLAVRADRDRARAALACLGDLVVPLLRENLDDLRETLGVRIEIPRLLASIGTAAAAEALLFSNIKDHPSLRYRIAESLFRLHRRNPLVPIDKERARAASSRRLKAFEHYRPLCHSLAAADASVPIYAESRRAFEVLRRAATDRLLQNLEAALHLCGLYRGAERMDRVARALGDAERAALAGRPPSEVLLLRADALEIIDVALAGDPIHDEMLRALEPPPTHEGRTENPPRWRDAAHTAAALRTSTDPMIAALARRVLASATEESDVGSFPSVLLQASWEAAVVPDPFASEESDFEELEEMDERLLTKVLALEKVDLFEGLSIDDVTAIAGIAEEMDAAPGEVLYKEGDPGTYMAVVIHGRVFMVRQGRTFMTVAAGESLGQVSVLDRGPRPITAVVSSDAGGAQLLRIDCDAFLDLVIDRPGLTRGVFAVLAKRMRTLIDLQNVNLNTSSITA